MAAGPATEEPRPRAVLVRLRGLVTDSVSTRPVESAVVVVLQGGKPVGAPCWTSPLGHYEIDRIPAGEYVLQVRRLDYRLFQRPLELSSADVSTDVVLAPSSLVLGTVTVQAHVSTATVDTHTGNQVFQQDDYHGSPATSTTEIVQQAVAGAARAPTSEVHIRGQHGEFTYYIDGLPVPPGISGSLSELFSPDIVEHIEFQTGGWDAEYGNRNSAVIAIGTRVPQGPPRVSASTYAGSFGSAGESFTASGNSGRFGLVVSGEHQATDMRREPVMRDPRTLEPLNFHNSGDDLYGFAKLQYAVSAHDLVVLDASSSRTYFQVPYDSTGGVLQDDHQLEHNGFANLGWHHERGASARDGALFAGLYVRWSRLAYTPGTVETPTFVFYPDTVRYNVREDRSSRTAGFKLDDQFPSLGPVQLKAGVDASLVDGHEHFETRDAAARPGPSVDADVHGGDLGLYAQASVQGSRWWELRPGLRYDVHRAPLAGSASQLSPRLRLNLNLDPQTTAWLYYGRLFVPSPIEDFHVLSEAGQGGQLGLPTHPERDHFVEGCVIHRFVSAATTLKLDAYHKQSGPAIDDNTLPGTALVATVNVRTVRVTGIESVVDVHPTGSLSGYLNVALSHAIAHGPITGGFSPTAYPVGWYDLDHDQRLSVVGSATYDRRRWFASATGIYGSGLTNGHPEAAPNETGLFDFNTAVKVAPSFVANASVGWRARLLGVAVRPEVFVDNVFDRRYLLKGAFTSGPSVGKPREVRVRVEIGG